MPRGRGEMFVVELSSHVINACPTAEIVRGVWTYLIFVTGATGGARVNFFGRCKFFSDVTQKIGNLQIKREKLAFFFTDLTQKIG